LQRFFAGCLINYDQIAGFIFKIFFIQGGSWYLTMDRTNWRWGAADINVLTLGIAYKGAAIPIYWELLDKRGNSDTSERIALMQKFIDQFGKDSIKGVLADREFIGKDWFAWLLKAAISFDIRIKSNTVTTNARGLSVDIDGLFYDLNAGEQRSLQGRRKVWGHLLYLAGLRLEDGDLLIVATPEEPENAIKTYGLRWEIETLFGCLKGRGFHFEDTHITGRERIKKLMVLLAIAFSWAHRTGEWRNEQSPIKIKKHGRPAISLFRYGLDFLCNALANVFYKPDLLKNSYQFISHMDIFQSIGASQ